MHVFVVFQRFQMCDYFCWLAKLFGQTFFEQCRQAMRFSHGRGVWKQQVNFDELAISSRAVTHSVAVQSEFTADCVQLLTDLYYRNLTLTRPAVINTIFCDPFFGVCFPATVGVDQVVASSTTYKFGANGGAGVEFPLGQSGLKLFGEARYARMFTTHGKDLTFVPVTFGVRW